MLLAGEVEINDTSDTRTPAYAATIDTNLVLCPSVISSGFRAKIKSINILCSGDTGIGELLFNAHGSFL
jgi:hypothetical protein